MKLYFLSSIFVLAAVTGCSAQTQRVADTSEVKTFHQLTDFARAYVEQRDTGKGLQYHKQALLYARKQGLHAHEAYALVHIAKLLKGQDTGQSLTYLNNALKIADRLNKKELRADILMAISSVYKQQRNYREALAALEAHQKLLQSSFEQNKHQEIAKLRAEELRVRERAVFITILVSLALLTSIFAFYYNRTKRLNKALYNSNKVKDTLFSIIGHDLRGPAGGIMQALEMVDQGDLDEQERKEIISLLKHQSRSFNETLNTLFNWASAQLKGVQPRVAPVDAIVIIQRSRDLLRVQAAAKNINISMPIESGISVLADGDHLDFVVRNLLSNAIKFSYPGGKIDITAERNNNTAVIAVRDSGKGIPADKLNELFSEGRLSSTFGTEGEKGTGLGLMLSWDFIRANHGRIWCDSKEGVGTTFYVSLPLAVNRL